MKVDSVSADKITAGTIEALIKIMSPVICGGEFMDLGENTKLVLNPQNAQHSNGNMALYNDSKLIFNTYDNFSAGNMTLAGYSIPFITIGETLGACPIGKWDFAHATSVDWGNNYPVARFAAEI